MGEDGLEEHLLNTETSVSSENCKQVLQPDQSAGCLSKRKVM